MAQPKQDTLQYARRLLDQLRDLDATIHGAYYDMGRILSAIAHGQLYDVLGYGSTGELINEELSFSRSQGYRYLHTYRHFRRLGYNKTEALDLINEYSFTYMSHYLPNATEKLGKRAVGNRIKEMLKKARQINFQLGENDLLRLVAALEQFGAYKQDGRLMNSSSALIKLVKHVEG